MLYGGVQHNLPSRFLGEIDSGFQTANNNIGYEGMWSPEPLRQNPALSNEPRYVPEVSEGENIRHKLFGVGTIVELDGDMATIYFKGKGTKKLNLSFAPIEKL